MNQATISGTVTGFDYYDDVGSEMLEVRIKDESNRIFTLRFHHGIDELLGSIRAGEEITASGHLPGGSVVVVD